MPPPCDPAVLLLIVQLVRVAPVPKFPIAPAELEAVLFSNDEFVTSSVQVLLIAPPNWAESFSKPESLTVSALLLAMPPPAANAVGAESLVKIHLTTVSVPLLMIPPPSNVVAGA